jgi:hypothetical protein
VAVSSGPHLLEALEQEIVQQRADILRQRRMVVLHADAAQHTSAQQQHTRNQHQHCELCFLLVQSLPKLLLNLLLLLR